MIPLVKPFLPPREYLMPELESILYSGYIAEGEVVKDFERQFGVYVDNPLTLSLNSGTAALHLSLLLANVGPGDEVISTALTAEPTNVSILQAGAKVIWADIDFNTGVLSAEAVREKITPKTKAIIVVHYAGIVADMDSFESISKEYNIPIIEDAAHALGGSYKGRKVGSISPFTIFSLQAIKHMTTVDGGMLCVKSLEMEKLGRIKRWFGLDKSKSRMDNDITVLGYKYHMNNVNATIGLVQLNYVDNIVNQYIANGKFYDEKFKNISGLDLIKYYQGSEPSYWLYTLKVENRKDFIKKMASNGIMASELHVRNDRHTIFAESKTSLPNLDKFYEKMVHLPCGWWVDSEIREKIVEVVKSGW